MLIAGVLIGTIILSILIFGSIKVIEVSNQLKIILERLNTAGEIKMDNMETYQHPFPYHPKLKNFSVIRGPGNELILFFYFKDEEEPFILTSDIMGFRE